LTKPFAKTGFIPDLPCLRRNVVNPIFDTSCFDLACILEKELHALIKLKVSQLLRSILQFILSQAEPSTPDILQNIIYSTHSSSMPCSIQVLSTQTIEMCLPTMHDRNPKR
jgi:hypothetical protein